jgi:hypothetical protein
MLWIARVLSVYGRIIVVNTGVIVSNLGAIGCIHLLPDTGVRRFHVFVVSPAVKEALIYSELPWHMDVPPFSVADKPLKMKEIEKSHFSIFVL